MDLRRVIAWSLVGVSLIASWDLERAADDQIPYGTLVAEIMVVWPAERLQQLAIELRDGCCSLEDDRGE